MSEWISVKDKLPKDDQYVLCLLQENHVNRCEVLQYIQNKKYANRKQWFEDSNDIRYQEVTHWMPYPELPDDVANKKVGYFKIY